MFSIAARFVHLTSVSARSELCLNQRRCAFVITQYACAYTDPGKWLISYTLSSKRYTRHCSSFYFENCSTSKLIVIHRQQKLFSNVSSCQHAVQCVLICVRLEGINMGIPIEKKRKDYAFRHQFIEKPSIILGCPVRHPYRSPC